MDSVNLNYGDDVFYSIKSLQIQLERTKLYINRMYKKSEVGLYVHDILFELIKGFQNKALVPFIAELEARNMNITDSYLYIELLKDEWDQISRIIHLIRTNYVDVNFFAPIIHEAQKLMNIDEYHIVPSTEGFFSLTNFHFIENLFVLNIPITSAYVPWEWSVFWHELAGANISLNSLDFTEEFEQIRNDVNQGETWTANWLEELYEDAYSVLVFGEAFIDVFHRILSRDIDRVNGDDQHPPLTIRINVACKLLELFGVLVQDKPYFSKAAITNREERVAELLFNKLPIQKFREIHQEPDNWPFTTMIRTVMQQYTKEPKRGDELQKETVDLLDSLTFEFPIVSLNFRELPDQLIQNGPWHKSNYIFSWRGELATLISTNERIRAKRYRIVSGAIGGNATRARDGQRIQATRYRRV